MLQTTQKFQVREDFYSGSVVNVSEIRIAQIARSHVHHMSTSPASAVRSTIQSPTSRSGNGSLCFPRPTNADTFMGDFTYSSISSSEHDRVDTGLRPGFASQEK
jgi:hypothetical protein